MSFLTYLIALLIDPLKLVFEFIFVIANRVVGHPGLAVIALSLLMNILVLPLYRRADAMQEEARDIDARLAPGVAHIKKVFSGDERMMILQTYYRQNNYKPTDALNGSVSLLLEVPFFMAAYQFLSAAGELQGASFGPITDLGAPDGLITLGSFTVNVLPVLMTLINVISSAIYLKGFPLKTKIQLYGMAAFFLVFLYDSPSGLVFYWTLNNLFSLVKTIFYKLKNPRKVGNLLMSVLGIGTLVFGLGLYRTDSMTRKLFVVGIGAALQLPLVLSALKGRISLPGKKTEPQPNRKLFTLGCVFLTFLLGLLIPSSVIGASAQEFVDTRYFLHPVWYVAYSGSMAAGFFLVWLQVFYWLADTKGKVLFDRLVVVLSGVMLVNYMFFGTDLGILSSSLQFEDGLNFSSREILLNIAVLGLLAPAVYLAAAKKPQGAAAVLLTAAVAVGSMSGINLITASRDIAPVVAAIENADEEDVPHLTLSRNGQNVVVIMLDRALGCLPEFLMEENPGLREQFAGFIYYDNVISFGAHTIVGSPSLLGGYEYTPVEMNRRDEEFQVDKHNEAVSVMPALFSQLEYDVTAFDVPLMSYQDRVDPAVYAEYPQTRVYETHGLFVSEDKKALKIELTRRNLFCYSLMKAMPLAVQSTIYNGGSYNRTENTVFAEGGGMSTIQVQNGLSTAFGSDSYFMNDYQLLENLPAMTEISETGKGSFFFMNSELTHTAVMLQLPGYVPADYINNTDYDAAHPTRYAPGYGTIALDTPEKAMHYQINMAAFLQLGKWFDFLRAEGLYDNTRIILVSDHGNDVEMLESLILEPDNMDKDITLYYPLLMVKDFGSTEYTVSHEFMTNADVPSLAVQDLIPEPVNPFTGKALTAREKTAHPQYISLSHAIQISENGGTTYPACGWALVSGNIWDPEAWTYFEDPQVVSDYSLHG